MHDGFGNLTDQDVIKGSAPTMHVAYNAATNRQTGDTADANGNIGNGYVYDIENRLLQAGSGMPQYGYDAGNKRIWRSTGDELTFWSGNQKWGTYGIAVSGSTIYFTLTGTNVYFGGRMIAKGTYNSGGTNDKVTLASIAQDRLGSMNGKFYPYGQERPSATTNDKEKFTGYFRDQATGLDYADQRYHQPGVGRFLTVDPLGASAKLTHPGSWNRYAYSVGDPINNFDLRGTECGQFEGYSPSQECDYNAPGSAALYDDSVIINSLPTGDCVACIGDVHSNISYPSDDSGSEDSTNPDGTTYIEPPEDVQIGDIGQVALPLVGQMFNLLSVGLTGSVGINSTQDESSLPREGSSLNTATLTSTSSLTVRIDSNSGVSTPSLSGALTISGAGGGTSANPSSGSVGPRVVQSPVFIAPSGTPGGTSVRYSPCGGGVYSVSIGLSNFGPFNFGAGFYLNLGCY